MIDVPVIEETAPEPGVAPEPADPAPPPIYFWFKLKCKDLSSLYRVFYNKLIVYDKDIIKPPPLIPIDKNKYIHIVILNFF